MGQKTSTEKSGKQLIFFLHNHMDLSSKTNLQLVDGASQVQLFVAEVNHLHTKNQKHINIIFFHCKYLPFHSVYTSQFIFQIFAYCIVFYRMQVNKNIHFCDTFKMAAIFQNNWFGFPCLQEFFPGVRPAGAFPRGSSPRRNPPPCPPPQKSCCFTAVHMVNE
jgi:hypothetical protein